MDETRRRRPTPKPRSGILQEIAGSLRGIIEGEAQLARAEMRDAARESGSLSARTALFAIIAALGLLPLIAFGVLALGKLLHGDFALSALIIGLVLSGGGSLLAWRSAKRIRAGEMALPLTRASISEEGRFLEQEAQNLAEHALRSVNDAIRRESRKRRPAS